MTRSSTRGLDREHVEQLLSEARGELSVGGRIHVLSRRLLGRPYEANPLIGSPDTPEVLTACLAGFDCVTYVETVLALSRASRPAGFVECLRAIRYEGGEVDWKMRNHYMTGWIRSNTRTGVIRPVRGIAGSTRKHRLLDAVPGLPPRRVRFSCVPRPLLKRLEPRLRTGDLIFFASTRSNLDVFHCGILVRVEGRLRLRHASRSGRSVVEQDLNDFLESNRMAGVIVVRPREMIVETGA